MNFTMNRARVDRIVSQFAKRKILVFGDVGLDKYTYGKVTRISPEAPIPVVEVTDTKLKLGLASNVADNISALGATPLLAGVIGDDTAGKDFLSLLRKSKITDRYLVIDTKRPTTLKERVVAESQQVVRIDYELQKKADSKLLRDCWARLEKAMIEADAVVIEDYAKGAIEMSICRQIVQTAEQKGIPVLVDPNGNASLQTYQGCTLMTPNTAEAEALSHVRIDGLAGLECAGQKLLAESGAKIVIITRGKDGMAIFARGEEHPIFIPTFAREVFDVSGAGDTVVATLALALVSGADIIEAALLSNFAAGVEVAKRGTATVTLSELKEHIEFVGAKRARAMTASANAARGSIFRVGSKVLNEGI